MRTQSYRSGVALAASNVSMLAVVMVMMLLPTPSANARTTSTMSCSGNASSTFLSTGAPFQKIVDDYPGTHGANQAQVYLKEMDR